MISTTAVVLTIVSFLGTAVCSVLGHFLGKTMTELKEVQVLANKTQSELAVLTKDHENKNDFMNDKIDTLNGSIVNLTKEIKELTSKIKE